MKYELEHITQENGRWYAEIKVSEENMTHNREHTGNLYGWDGMAYNSLVCILKEYYNISIPKAKDLKLIKHTTSRKIYTLK